MICSVSNCTKKSSVATLCHMHYSRRKRHGDVNVVMRIRVNSSTGRTPTYISYGHMKNRCYNPNYKGFNNYGGRGIKVCDRWLGVGGYINFLKDMGERPNGLTLDRIDNDKGYSPDNCKWATMKEQQNNRRNNIVRAVVLV